MTTELIIILLLIVANGVFAMSEMAVVASRKIRLQQRADDGDNRARAALDLARNPAQFLSTVQIGITLVGVLAGAFGGARLSERVAVHIAAVPLLEPYASGIALGVVVAAITFLSLILGELVPKNIALTAPETVAAWVARPMMLLAAVGRPVVAILTGTTRLVLAMVGMKQQAESHLTEEEIKAVISQGAESGVIAATEGNIVQRVLQLGEQRVASIMTPRLDIEWIDADASPEALREFLASHSHTQFVVCQGSLDNVLGIVWAAELLPVATLGRPIELRGLTREALFVPDSMPAINLLEAFRTSHKHVALVMDEFGEVEGLVTVTDLLEALVGHLPAGASEGAGDFVARPDGSWLVDAGVSMEEAGAWLGLPEPPDEENGAYHTLGGFMMARLGRIPTTADVVDWEGFHFEVVDMDGRRVDKVLVSRPGATPPSGTG